MSAPSDGAGIPAWHYDGQSAVRHEVVLVADGGRFSLIGEDHATGPFAFADLIALDRADAAFGLKGHHGWRLGFAGGAPAEIAARLPGRQRYGGFIDRIGLWPAAAACAVVAAIVVATVLASPPLLAQLVPPSAERNIGAAMVGDFGGHLCRAPAGRAALDRLAVRLAPADKDVRLEVANIPILNAVTLPGNIVILFEPIIKEAASPDEVAGVAAHELGHAAHRDVLVGLIRQFGLGLLLGGVNSNVGGWTHALVSAQYSQKTEARADADAMATLAAAHISTVPTAAFFTRLAKSHPDGGPAFAYFASHPLSADRARRFRAAEAGHHADAPALDAADWAALQRICADDPDVTTMQDNFRF